MFHRRGFGPSLLWKIGLLAGVFALASCKRCKDPEQRAEWITEKVASKLDLNEAQKAKLTGVKTLVLGLHKEMKDTKLGSLDEIIRQVETNKVDQAKLVAIVTDRTDSIRKNAPAVIAALAEFEQSLDDKQRTKVAGFLKHIRERVADHQEKE